jgi:hypothetical protein
MLQLASCSLVVNAAVACLAHVGIAIVVQPDHVVVVVDHVVVVLSSHVVISTYAQMNHVAPALLLSQLMLFFLQCYI